MATVEELEELLTEEHLNANISDKKAKIDKYRKGIDVLRSSDDFSSPFIQGRISYLQKIIEDYEEAISTWQKVLELLPLSGEQERSTD